MMNNKLLNIVSDFFPVFLLIFFFWLCFGWAVFLFFLRRYSTLNVVIILNFKAT